MFLTTSPIIDLLLLCVVGLFFIHFVIERRRGHWMLIDPFNAFWGGVLVCYVFQPITYYEQLQSEYGSAVLVETFVAIIWTLLWIMAGYHSRLGPRVGRKLPPMPSQVRADLLSVAGMILVGLGLVGYVIQVGTAGGFQNWISQGRGGTDWSSLNGYLAALEYFLPAGVTILVFTAELMSASRTIRAAVWSLAGIQWLWLVYLGSRSRTIMFLGTLAAAYYLPRRKNPRWWLVATAGVLLFLLTTFQAQYRGNFTNLSFNLNDLDSRQVMKSILPKQLGGNMGEDTGKPMGELEFNCVAAVIDLVPKQVDYNYGYTLLELVTRPIPRAIWPAKRYPQLEAQTPIMQLRRLSSFWIETENGRYLGGPAFTFVGYWYQVGGFVALCVAGFLAGVGFRTIRMVYDRMPGNAADIMMYTLLLPIGFYEAASNSLSWMFYLPLIILPVFFLLRISRGSSQPDLATSGITA